MELGVDPLLQRLQAHVRSEVLTDLDTKTLSVLNEYIRSVGLEHVMTVILRELLAQEALPTNPYPFVTNKLRAVEVGLETRWGDDEKLYDALRNKVERMAASALEREVFHKKKDKVPDADPDKEQSSDDTNAGTSFQNQLVQSVPLYHLKGDRHFWGCCHIMTWCSQGSLSALSSQLERYLRSSTVSTADNEVVQFSALSGSCVFWNRLVQHPKRVCINTEIVVKGYKFEKCLALFSRRILEQTVAIEDSPWDTLLGVYIQQGQVPEDRPLGPPPESYGSDTSTQQTSSAAYTAGSGNRKRKAKPKDKWRVFVPSALEVLPSDISADATRWTAAEMRANKKGFSSAVHLNAVKKKKIFLRMLVPLALSETGAPLQANTDNSAPAKPKGNANSLFVVHEAPETKKPSARGVSRGSGATADLDPTSSASSHMEVEIQYTFHFQSKIDGKVKSFAAYPKQTLMHGVFLSQRDAELYFSLFKPKPQPSKLPMGTAGSFGAASNQSDKALAFDQAAVDGYCAELMLRVLDAEQSGDALEMYSALLQWKLCSAAQLTPSDWEPPDPSKPLRLRRRPPAYHDLVELVPVCFRMLHSIAAEFAAAVQRTRVLRTLARLELSTGSTRTNLLFDHGLKQLFAQLGGVMGLLVPSDANQHLRTDPLLAQLREELGLAGDQADHTARSGVGLRSEFEALKGRFQYLVDSLALLSSSPEMLLHASISAEALLAMDPNSALSEPDSRATTPLRPQSRAGDIVGSGSVTSLLSLHSPAPGRHGNSLLVPGQNVGNVSSMERRRWLATEDLLRELQYHATAVSVSIAQHIAFLHRVPPRFVSECYERTRCRQLVPCPLQFESHVVPVDEAVAHAVRHPKVPKEVARESLFLHYIVDSELDEFIYQSFASLFLQALVPNPYGRLVNEARNHVTLFETWQDSDAFLLESLVGNVHTYHATPEDLEQLDVFEDAPVMSTSVYKTRQIWEPLPDSGLDTEDELALASDSEDDDSALSFKRRQRRMLRERKEQERAEALIARRVNNPDTRQFRSFLYEAFGSYAALAVCDAEWLHRLSRGIYKNALLYRVPAKLGRAYKWSESTAFIGDATLLGKVLPCPRGSRHLPLATRKNKLLGVSEEEVKRREAWLRHREAILAGTASASSTAAAPSDANFLAGDSRFLDDEELWERLSKDIDAVNVPAVCGLGPLHIHKTYFIDGLLAAQACDLFGELVVAYVHWLHSKTPHIVQTFYPRVGNQAASMAKFSQARYRKKIAHDVSVTIATNQPVTLFALLLRAPPEDERDETYETRSSQHRQRKRRQQQRMKNRKDRKGKDSKGGNDDDDDDDDDDDGGDERKRSDDKAARKRRRARRRKIGAPEEAPGQAGFGARYYVPVRMDFVLQFRHSQSGVVESFAAPGDSVAFEAVFLSWQEASRWFAYSAKQGASARADSTSPALQTYLEHTKSRIVQSYSEGDLVSAYRFGMQYNIAKKDHSSLPPLYRMFTSLAGSLYELRCQCVTLQYILRAAKKSIHVRQQLDPNVLYWHFLRYYYFVHQAVVDNDGCVFHEGMKKYIAGRLELLLHRFRQVKEIDWGQDGGDVVDGLVDLQLVLRSIEISAAMSVHSNNSSSTRQFFHVLIAEHNARQPQIPS